MQKAQAPAGRSRGAPGHFLVLAIIAVAICVNVAHAQTFPAKPVRVVVGVAPGGGIDGILNILRAKLTELWGYQIIIDNRPGAGGTIGSDIVAKSTPDGHTLLFGTISTHAIAPALYKILPYDHIKDFAPISLTTTAPNVLVMHPAVPANNVREMLAYARANPGKINYGSAGIGSSMHLSMELLGRVANVKMVHIPYKGVAPAMMDLLGGQIQAICANLPSQLPNIKSGKVRALGVTSTARSPQLPDAPTFIESGIALEVLIWHALFAPAAVPPPVLVRLNADVVKVLNMPDVQRRLDEQGVTASPSTPLQLAGYVRAETAKWAKAVKASGAKAE